MTKKKVPHRGTFFLYSRTGALDQNYFQNYYKVRKQDSILLKVLMK